MRSGSRKRCTRIAGAVIASVMALGATVGFAGPASADQPQISIPVTGTAQGTAHLEYWGDIPDAECVLHFHVNLTITSGPLAGGTLEHDVCWDFSGTPQEGNRRARLVYIDPPPDGTFFSGRVTSNVVTACSTGSTGCAHTGDVLSETRTFEFWDRLGPRFGRARTACLTVHLESTFLDPIFYDGTLDADLSVSATLSGQLKS